MERGTQGVLGLLAGNGDLPRLVAEGARAAGWRVVTAAMGPVVPELRGVSDAYSELALGQLGGVLDVFRREKATGCVMAGHFAKASVFGGFRPDLTLLGIVARLGRQLQDDRALREVARVFEEAGVPVLAVPPFVPAHMAREGVMTSRRPTPDEADDIRYGMQVARTTGGLDVGQTVVVRRGVVLAVEAVEGTDRAIERGAALGRHGGAGGKGGVVVCKVVKPHQDLRLDLPAVGPQTVETCVRHKVRVLAVEAQRTIMVDRDKTVRAANDAKLVIVGVPRPEGVPAPPWSA
ncbi:MAG: UDP-2,3-diacylglucosamine diphosphatase LpxI [Deltaproteobacteria bacterium]|nr:UDP-2,3-diacylglucosamine diphosphatase LpxI [Deltaproteobacteria bacterium]